MMKLLMTTLAAGVAAECDGSPCQQLSTTTPSRLMDTGMELEADPQMGAVNTFTAVDTCATSEIKGLTSWVLSYYEDVSNQLDSSFTSILTTARLANSALRYLGALSAELQAQQRLMNISNEMNAMLRTCLADAMHLSASMQRCDLSFSHDNLQVDSLATTGGQNDVDSVFIKPLSTDAEGTCLSAVCEHNTAWKNTCGPDGFLGDLERVAASHDMQGTQYAFTANRETAMHTPPRYLYTDDSDASTMAMLAEDLQTQEAALLSRVSMWLEVQFNGMMVMVRKALNGGQFAQATDIETCEGAGMKFDTVQWLSLAFQKCEGSMVRTWLKVTPLNANYMRKLVEKMAQKIPNVIKPGKAGVLFGGLLTNMCKNFQDIEGDILDEIKKLQAEHDAMHDGSGDAKSINTFYLNNVAEVPDAEQQSFTAQTGPTQNWYMSGEFMKVPKSFEQ